MNLVFLLEEPLVREILKELLPRILPDRVTVRYIPFEGKQDLEKNIVRRLRGWQAPNSIFVVLRDQDAEDCRAVKLRLVEMCRSAGRSDTVIRIACRELESWYFGDLAAVESGLGLANLTRHERSRKYRIPDEIRYPAVELSKITGNAYQKVSGSRAIGPKLSLDSNKSHSFRVFIQGVRQAVGTAGPP